MTDAERIAKIEAILDAMERENERKDRVLEEMSKDIKHLLALANQGKGGIWVGMSIAGTIGAVGSWIAHNILGK